MNVLRQLRLAFQRERGSEHRRKRCPQFVAEHGEKLIFRQIRASLLFQFQVCLLQLRGERLRLFEQVFRSRACFDRVEHNADALG